MVAGPPMDQMEGNPPGPRTSVEAWEGLMGLFDAQCRISMNPDLSKGENGHAAILGSSFLAPSTCASPFDPRGKLVIYGYSAGGFNAMNLCRRIIHYRSWYDFTSRRLCGKPAAHSALFAPARVDLLITVDPCRKLANPPNLRRMSIDSMAAGEDRRTPDRNVVLAHVNYHQQLDPDFWGVPIDGAVNLPCYPPNGEIHKLMARRTIPSTQVMIGKCLDGTLLDFLRRAG